MCTYAEYASIALHEEEFWKVADSKGRISGGWQSGDKDSVIVIMADDCQVRSEAVACIERDTGRYSG